MTIYTFITSASTASGSTSKSSLRIPGGLLKQVVIRSNTASTVFRAAVVNENSMAIATWGFHTGEINDYSIEIPVDGVYIFQVTNASPDDTFSIYGAVREK